MFDYRPFLSNSRSRPVLAAAMGALSLLFLAPAAHADIVFFDGAGGVQPEENVLLRNDNVLGMSLTGTTNQTNTLITFTQPLSPENLVSPSEGQSRIAGADGAFTSLRTAVASGTTFSLFEANPMFLSGGTAFTVRVTEDNGQISNRNFVSGNGQSFFGVQAVAGQRISFIDILAPANTIADVRQIRIGGIATATTPNPIPEPSEWMAMGMAAASVGGLMVRARRRGLKGRSASAAA